MNVVRIAVIAAAASLMGCAAASATSYNCNGKLTHTEATICDNPKLSNLDEVMASQYYQIRGSLPSAAARRQFDADQRSWLQYRNSCGANVRCISQAYQSRLQYFAGYGD